MTASLIAPDVDRLREACIRHEPRLHRGLADAPRPAEPADPSRTRYVQDAVSRLPARNHVACTQTSSCTSTRSPRIAPFMLETAPFMLETAPVMPRSGDMLLTAPNGVTRHVVVLDELNARPLAALHKGEGA